MQPLSWQLLAFTGENNALKEVYGFQKAAGTKASNGGGKTLKDFNVELAQHLFNDLTSLAVKKQYLGLPPAELGKAVGNCIKLCVLPFGCALRVQGLILNSMKKTYTTWYNKIGQTGMGLIRSGQPDVLEQDAVNIYGEYGCSLSIPQLI
jgi:hypothetical protein